MTEKKNTTMFDQLNDALFAEMENLQLARPDDPDGMERAIKHSNAVSKLAANIINNANTAIDMMRFQMDAGETLENRAAAAPKMLTGGE